MVCVQCSYCYIGADAHSVPKGTLKDTATIQCNGPPNQSQEQRDVVQSEIDVEQHRPFPDILAPRNQCCEVTKK